jgi:NADH:ubiquinone oxidoreductase subunit 2 (subunit N)
MPVCPVMSLFLLISSLLNALYYLPIIIPAFFEQPEGEDLSHDHDDHEVRSV